MSIWRRLASPVFVNACGVPAGTMRISPAPASRRSSPIVKLPRPSWTMRISAYGCVWRPGPRPGGASTKMTQASTSWSSPTSSWAMLLNGRSWMRTARIVSSRLHRQRDPALEAGRGAAAELQDRARAVLAGVDAVVGVAGPGVGVLRVGRRAVDAGAGGLREEELPGVHDVAAAVAGLRVAAVRVDLGVDVRRPARVEAGIDRGEPDEPVAVGELDAAQPRLADRALAGLVRVRAESVGMPDVHGRALERPARGRVGDRDPEPQRDAGPAEPDVRPDPLQRDIERPLLLGGGELARPGGQRLVSGGLAQDPSAAEQHGAARERGLQRLTAVE